jgi:hypothetical protein
MKRGNFLWVTLSGFLLMIFCGDPIVYRVFGLGSHTAVPYLVGYSSGVVLVSTALITQLLTPRIKALEEKVAALTKGE